MQVIAGWVASRWRYGWLLLIMTLLQACAAPGQRAPVSDPGAESGPSVEERPSSIPVRSVPVEDLPAVRGLLQQANSHYSDGDWSAAIAAAERGLRIERRVADFYLVLARSYQQLGELERAREFARQGIRYTQPDDSVRHALQQIQGNAE